MSRIIVKNLPKKFSEERFREVFGEYGQVTDCKLLFSKDGKFRRFGFIGFKTTKEAESAQKFFHKSFIDTCKITVEIAKDLGDPELPRPWSKYSEKSSAYQKLCKEREERKQRLLELQGIEKSSDNKKKDSKLKISLKESENLNSDLENNAEFKEFVQAHKNRGSKKHWDNDVSVDIAQKTEGRKREKKKQESKEKVIFDEDSDDSNEEDTGISLSEKNEYSDQEDEDSSSKKALDSKISDMDYLKSFINKGSSKKLDSDEDEEIPEENETAESSESSSESDTEESSDESDKEHITESSNCKPHLTIKMRGLPFKAKEKDIIDFFAPIKVEDIRLLKVNKKTVGVAYVDFSNAKDVKDAMKHDKDCIKGRYIELFIDEGTEKRETAIGEREPAWVKKAAQLSALDGDEAISESGRLFLRNLPFSCTEEEVQEVFSKYGPLSEVYLPLDKDTSKPFGIGFVTFMMPEHAVKAFNELDGHVFQGRMLHILPAKAKKSFDEEDDGPGSSYKKKKRSQQKALSSNSHNWNTLFLGVNAVADVMADKYQTSKAGILDAQSRQSLAVRMALGETQLVSETRDFLEAQGVKLDVFGQPSAKRSKTVLLVKNLPFNTSPEELRQTFEPFGQLGRVVLPPSGITALIEFAQPSEAKKAFTKLAYTKFKDVPLYLEWAPTEVFTSEVPQQKSEQVSESIEEKESKSQDNAEEDDDNETAGDDQGDEGYTIYIKNLNFETKEETIREKFSSVGPVTSVVIAKKKDAKKPDVMLSMGYGFVEYKKKKHAQQAIKNLQHCKIDDHAVELKMSNRKTLQPTSGRKKVTDKKQTSSKILVRNVPFEASKKELKELFCTFGEIKTLRLPKKMAGSGNHRGFAFVDFLTKQVAKRAFKALATSTHLYGRRLVLEWAEDEDSIDSLRKRTASKYHDSEPEKKKKTEEILKDMEFNNI